MESISNSSDRLRRSLSMRSGLQTVPLDTFDYEIRSPSQQLDQYQKGQYMKYWMNNPSAHFQTFGFAPTKYSLAELYSRTPLQHLPLSPPANQRMCCHSNVLQQKNKEHVFSAEDVAKYSEVMRHHDFLTPPATASNSKSSLAGSHPPASPFIDFPEFARFCDQDFDILNGGEKEVMRNETLPYAYPTHESVYTAERVHSLVKNQRNAAKARIVSNKVFVGGINNTMNRETINTFFAQFGHVFVDWPVKGPRVNARGKQLPMSSYSYLFLVYYEEKSVLNLINVCHKPSHNEFYVKVPGCNENLIQIRPWFLENAFYVLPEAENKHVIDIHRTVFVGGLPRIVTAEEIAKMFCEFGKVLLVTIDIDQDYGYPKGAARVTFARDSSFSAALEKKYLRFENIDSSKTTIEIKPYVMEDVGCDQCGGLWFNPFVDIFTSLKESQQQQQKPAEAPSKDYNMWSFENPFSAVIPDSQFDELSSNQNLETSSTAPLKEINRFFNLNEEKVDFVERLDHMNLDRDEVQNGAAEFYEMARSMNLHTKKTVQYNGEDIPIGPELWNRFVPEPQLGIITEINQMRLDQQVESLLKMKRGNVYSNKSSYCKDRPCRQYYCSSCSHKLHSSLNTHVLLPAGKQERRPRKDKNMYLVRQQ